MKNQTTQSSSCFVLMPFEQRLVNVWDAVIRPAIQQAGLTPLRSDEMASGVNIMPLVRHQIIQARVVVAVLTGANPNVMYELGLAHAAKKQVLLFQSREEQLPFDLHAIHVLKYDPQNFPESRQILVRALVDIVHARESGDHFPELTIPDPGIMEEYHYLKQIRKTLQVRVEPQFCSIFFNNRLLGSSPQTIYVNPDVDQKILAISAINRFEHYQTISDADLDKGILEITMVPRTNDDYLERVHSWLMWRRHDPDSLVLSMAIANYLRKKEIFDQAREESLFCIAKAPGWFHGYNSLGVLECTMGNFDESKRYFDRVTDLVGHEYIGWYNLAGVASMQGNHVQAMEYLEKILTSPERSESFRQIHCKTKSNPLLMDEDLENLRKSPDHKKKFAVLARKFDKLRLSDPRPLISEPVAEKQVRGDRRPLPFALQRFAIKDFQCIKSAKLDALPMDAPWIMITGDNGDGKTSLLQALTIGLHGEEDAEHMLRDNPLAKMGVETREGERVVVRNFFRRNGSWVLTDHRGKGVDPVTSLVAYGPSRLDISREETRATEKAEHSPVYNLLRQRGNLRNIEHWLKMRLLEAQNTDAGATSDGLNVRRATRVQEILVELMPGVTRMNLVGSEFKYTEKGHVVTAHNLSSGQQNLLAMVGDLLIWFYSIHPKVVEPEDFHGIVLIDELDVHLHPNRQKELPGQLSRIFPNVQFVATTHSVIPILGAPAGSIYLWVTRDPLSGTRVERLDIEVANLLPNSILTSPLFDMKSILARQNSDPAKVHTQVSFEDIRRNAAVDQALQQIGQAGNILPKGFLDSEE
ncbi:MAG: AAA family ATPase [Magnetococcus sp. DMHC-1]